MPELQDIQTLPPGDAQRQVCEADLETYREKFFELQNLFYADGKYGLLIIIQGMDTSGKDSVVRHVMSGMNPLGVRVESFKVPTEEER